MLAGMQWAAESGADVVNMSLGDTMPSDGTDPMSQAVDALSEQYRHAVRHRRRATPARSRSPRPALPRRR